MASHAERCRVPLSSLLATPNMLLRPRHPTPCTTEPYVPAPCLRRCLQARHPPCATQRPNRAPLAPVLDLQRFMVAKPTQHERSTTRPRGAHLVLSPHTTGHPAAASHKQNMLSLFPLSQRFAGGRFASEGVGVGVGAGAGVGRWAFLGRRGATALGAISVSWPPLLYRRPLPCLRAGFVGLPATLRLGLGWAGLAFAAALAGMVRVFVALPPCRPVFVLVGVGVGVRRSLWHFSCLRPSAR